MNKEFLKGLGIEDSVAEQIINEHKETLKNKYVPIDRFNTVNDELKHQKETVKTLNGQLDGLKKINPEELQAEIKRLQGENNTAKEKYENDLKNLKISNAIEKALTSAKAKNLTAVKALLKMDDLTLDGDEVKGLDKQIKALSEDEGTKFLFDTVAEPNKPKIKGAEPQNNNNNGGGNESKGAAFAQKYNQGVFTRLGINSKE